MSIVISFLIPKYAYIIYADRKSISNIDRQPSDDLTKIYKINDKVASGITGYAEWGLKLIRHLVNHSSKLPSVLIEEVKQFSTIGMKVPSTFSMGGIYDDNRLFTFSYATETKLSNLYFEEPRLTIATYPETLVDELTIHFRNELNNNVTVHDALQNSIKLASIRSPETISATFDSIVIPVK
jgi:hypothetical protein